jgi:hypothetical protein
MISAIPAASRVRCVSSSRASDQTMPMLASTNAAASIAANLMKASMAASERDRTIHPAIARASASSCVFWSALPRHRRSLSTPAIEQIVMSMHLKISTAISSRLAPPSSGTQSRRRRLQRGGGSRWRRDGCNGRDSAADPSRPGLRRRRAVRSLIRFKRLLRWVAL